MDQYKVRWIGQVGIGVHTDDGKSHSFSLAKEQSVPTEFKLGDQVTIKMNPGKPPASEGYYEITHIPSGKILRITGLNEQFEIEP